MGVEAQSLLIQRAQVHQMRREAEIFLGDLQFQRDRSASHGAEQRMRRLAGLKIDGAVFDLQQHVAMEPTVERHELIESLHGAILAAVVRLIVDVSPAMRIRIDEGAPNDDSAVRRQGVRKHIGTVGMRSMVVLRPGLAFRIRLHQESAEVGYVAIDFRRFLFPPGTYRGIERGPRSSTRRVPWVR